jgi:hypothetical protein
MFRQCETDNAELAFRKIPNPNIQTPKEITNPSTNAEGIFLDFGHWDLEFA